MTEKTTFVAREKQQAQLKKHLNQMLTGTGHTSFVAGEAGIGKTALVKEFSRLAQIEHGTLLVAVGQSDAHTGMSDPFLPFREVLAQLTGDVEAKLAKAQITEENAERLRQFLRFSGQVIVELGPDLIELFIPLGGLITRAGTFAAERLGWLDRLEARRKRPHPDRVLGGTGISQEHIFEQYINVLLAMAEKRPLMVVLDDLHWADRASIDLLFHLGRRVAAGRVLIVGTYRPIEVTLGRDGKRHPLEKVLAELTRYSGEPVLDLDQMGGAERRSFVDALLNTEPNWLTESFRRALNEHTNGHPLFTVELLRDMQERGDLVRNARGRWVEGSELHWHDLPVRVEAVFEERVRRLDENLREALKVASVEGEIFTAEVVAGVQALEPRTLIRQLGEKLERQHRLVNSQGVRKLVTSGQRLCLYRFRHSLFQTYLYDDLSEPERAYLHEDVGSTLEGLYGEEVDQVAVQLAHHFVLADVREKARIYLRRAGEQAAARFANSEAVSYFDRALELTPNDQLNDRYALVLAREQVYDLQGEREAQKQDLDELEQLAVGLGDDVLKAEVALRLANYAGSISEFAEEMELAQTAVTLAQTAGDTGKEATAHLLWGKALTQQGHFDESRAPLRRALALAQEAHLPWVESRSSYSMGVAAVRQGDLSQARTWFERSLLICQSNGDRIGEGQAMNGLAALCTERGELSTAKGYFEQTLSLLREIGSRRGECTVLGNLGCLADLSGDYAEAWDLFERTIGLCSQIGLRSGAGHAYGNLSALAGKLGEYDKAAEYAANALSIEREVGDRYTERTALHNLCELSLDLGDNKAAQRYGQEELALARQIGYRQGEGYALNHVGYALTRRGRSAEAESVLKQALTLLEELADWKGTMTARTGLARVYLACGKPEQALFEAEVLLGALQAARSDTTWNPFPTYLTCYRVLKANSDTRALPVLADARELLNDWSVRIRDEKMRHSFLDNVAAHREIVDEYEKWR